MISSESPSINDYIRMLFRKDADPTLPIGGISFSAYIITELTMVSFYL